MAGTVEQKLAAEGITLAEPRSPIANYVPFVRSGNLLFVSGQVCMAADGGLIAKGKLGAGVTVEQGYAAAKGGVAQLTKALANEWAPHRINVNAIAPGYMETDNTTALRQDAARFRQISERIPAGRWGKPDDLAGAAVFLASRASDYVHGHVLVVDGGWMGR